MRIYFLEWNTSYENLMIENLAEYGVQGKNNIMKHFTKKNIKLKKLGIPNLFFVKLHMFFKLRMIKEDDLIVCNGFSVLGFLDIIKTIKCKKILVIRDAISHLEKEMKEKKKWLSPQDDFIGTVKNHFNLIYSFDPTDCKKHSLVYLNQFLPYTSKNIKNIKNNTSTTNKTCFFIGTYRIEREKALYEIYEYLSHTHFEADFYLYDKYKNSSNYPPFCKNTLLSYADNIEKVISADALVEINHVGQDGVTLRAIEAIAFNKKLITNNTYLVNHEFYDPNRFFILGRDNIDNLPIFLENEVSPIPEEIINKYTADSMLHTLIRNINQTELMSSNIY